MKYLEYLKLENLNLKLLSQSFEKECNLEEEYYKIKYTHQPIKEVITMKDVEKYTCKHKLEVPPKNEFIPNDITVLPKGKDDSKYPEKITDPNDKLLKVWYKKDNFYGLPKAKLMCDIYLSKDLFCSNFHYISYISALF